ncbi:hypothetical protein ACFQ3Z_40050 [Streptomyces nogalater]
MITELAVERVEFTCGHCWHSWSADYDVQYYRDENGDEWEYFTRDGDGVPSPTNPRALRPARSAVAAGWAVSRPAGPCPCRPARPARPGGGSPRPASGTAPAGTPHHPWTRTPTSSPRTPRRGRLASPDAAGTPRASAPLSRRPAARSPRSR